MDFRLFECCSPELLCNWFSLSLEFGFILSVNIGGVVDLEVSSCDTSLMLSPKIAESSYLLPTDSSGQRHELNPCVALHSTQGFGGRQKQKANTVQNKTPALWLLPSLQNIKVKGVKAASHFKAWPYPMCSDVSRRLMLVPRSSPSSTLLHGRLSVYLGSNVPRDSKTTGYCLRFQGS